MIIFLLGLCLFFHAIPAHAADGVDRWKEAEIPIAFHVLMSVAALHKIWTHDTDGRAWQVAWSAISIFVPAFGPILFFGLAEMPPPSSPDKRFKAGAGGGAYIPRETIGFGDGSASGVPGVAEALTDIFDPPGSNEKDPAEALRAAETGDAKAQSRYGLMLEYGDGCAQDYQAAVHWYRRAAEQGFAPAQALLSNMYAKAQGVDMDLPTALFWMALAAADDSRFQSRCDVLAERLPEDKRAAALERARNWYPVTGATKT